MKKTLLLVFCCLLAFSSLTICSAQSYQITDQQLSKLSQNLDQLELNLTQQDKQLQIAKESLEKSEQQIQISNNQITLLENQLSKASQSINLATNSLDHVNKLLLIQEQETKAEIRKIKFQRDIIGIGLLYMLFKK